MESNNLEDDDNDDEMDDSEDDNEDAPVAARKKPVSGLIRLTGKSKTSQKSTPTKAQTKNGNSTNGDVVEIPASDNDATPKPVMKRTPRGRPKSSKSTKVERPTKKKNGIEMMVPDSAGEARDIWIISSDDE